MKRSSAIRTRGHRTDEKRKTNASDNKNGKDDGGMRESDRGDVDDDEYDNSTDIDMQPIEVKRVPTEQLKGLTEEQLNEVFTKVITATNPNVSKAVTRYNYNEGCYKLAPSVNHLAVHFEMDGLLIHVDSEEAKEQIHFLSMEQSKAIAANISADTEKKSQHTSTADDNANVSASVPAGSGSSSTRGVDKDEEKDATEDDDDDADAAAAHDRALKNQFNFSERATQTFNNPMRDREVSTEPPPTEEFSASVTHWEIFDAYVEDIEKQMAVKARQEKGGKASDRQAVQSTNASKSQNADDDDGKANTEKATATSTSPAAAVAQTGSSTTSSSNSSSSSSSSSMASASNGGTSGSSASSTSSAASSALLSASSALSSCESLTLAVKTMERLVNQNAEAELFQDFKYYEDKNELKRADGNDKRGSFLPLWKFLYDKGRRKTITAIVWNPEYTDLFAVSFGSYDFMKQGSGLICVYSLKNTQYPEYKFSTDSGVMTLDFHPQHTALLVAGLYDGTVVVYDVRSKSNDGIYFSSDPKTKHTDPVWQVRWAKEEIGKNINFFSVSSDGRVTNWIMNKNELIHEEVVELKLTHGQSGSALPSVNSSFNATASKTADRGSESGVGNSTPEKVFEEKEEMRPKASEERFLSVGIGTSGNGDDSSLVGLAGGCCFDFNPHQEHLFVVGTEEGAIHLYSKAYNSQFLKSFEGHHMSVYAIQWNPFHPNVFLSCSADWTVKLWEISTSRPVMSFDLNCSVADIAWAPYSATVFAVVTSDGKVRIYDLLVNKHEPIGEIRVNKKAKLTHVSFNPREPIICVGDDRGIVSILKLSQNLRRMSAPTLEEIDDDEEIEKLDRLLIITERDAPNVLTPAFFTPLRASSIHMQNSKSKDKHVNTIQQPNGPLSPKKGKSEGKASNAPGRAVVRK